MNILYITRKRDAELHDREDDPEELHNIARQQLDLVELTSTTFTEAFGRTIKISLLIELILTTRQRENYARLVTPSKKSIQVKFDDISDSLKIR